MQRRFLAILLEAILVSTWALYGCWLFLQTVFWTIAGPVSSFEEGFQQVFFRQDGQGLLFGGGIDLIGTLWIFSNTRSILKGEQRSFLEDVYAPIGFDLGMNTGFAWADAALSWPLMEFFGEPEFYNLHIVLTLFLTQVGVYILLRSWSTPFAIALVLMSFSILNPFCIEEVFQGRPTQIHLIFHCLYLWSMTKIIQGKGWLWSIVGGISLALSCLVYWFSGAAIGFMGLLMFALYAKNRTRNILKVFILGFSAISIVLAITWRVSKQFLLGTGASQFAQLRRPPMAEIDWGFINIPIQKWQYIYSMGDLGTLIQPLLIPSSILLGAFIASLIDRHRIKNILLLFVIITIPIEGALVFSNGIWSPSGYAMLQTIFPPLARCTVPHRMMVAPLLFSILMIGRGGFALVRKQKHSISRSLSSVAIALGVLFFIPEQVPLKENTSTSKHGIDYSYLQYTQLYPGGLIDVPLIASEKTYVQQRFHKQMIIGGPGQISVRPNSHRKYYQRNSVLQALESLAEKGKTKSIKQEDMKQLRDDGFRLIVVHLNMSKATTSDYETLLGITGEYDKSKNRFYIPIP